MVMAKSSNKAASKLSRDRRAISSALLSRRAPPLLLRPPAKEAIGQRPKETMLLFRLFFSLFYFGSSI
jgi:hypothetical protein